MGDIGCNISGLARLITQDRYAAYSNGVNEPLQQNSSTFGFFERETKDISNYGQVRKSTPEWREGSSLQKREYSS